MAPFLLTSLAFAGAADAATIATGQDWALDDARGPVVRLNDCEGKICAQLAALVPDDVAATDIRNPNPALRGRPKCGLNIMTGLTRSPKGLVGGTLYDPQTGKSYTVRIDDRSECPKVLIPIGPFTASMALLPPASVMNKCLT